MITRLEKAARPETIATWRAAGYTHVAVYDAEVPELGWIPDLAFPVAADTAEWWLGVLLRRADRRNVEMVAL